ncbi:hypothetical protein CgunFtcFv8_001299 [Champsocephalus gunnari]|uniref:Uncharacterized protein n=1 Tax=Champsocephalus gunnari TaxID=52237 RepID=A0AAN8DJM4_CHAGU|nr:hypothetical protein CgunFtcFv8_001299 [Champsocephalus gunnari]
MDSVREADSHGGLCRSSSWSVKGGGHLDVWGPSDAHRGPNTLMGFRLSLSSNLQPIRGSADGDQRETTAEILT